MVTQVPSGGLTSVEQSLVDQVIRGEWLDLAAEDEVIDEAAMRSWSDSRTCRASVIRDILLGQLAPGPDPHGLRLRATRISGRVDLDSLSTDVNLELKDCFIDEGLSARDAHLASVALSGCQIEHPSEPPLNADRLTCNSLSLGRARLSAHADPGAVRLTGAHISGDLNCDEAHLHNSSGPALNGDGLQVGQAMFLRRRFTATGAGNDGTVRLAGAHIGGNLACDGARLLNRSGPALSGDSLQVAGNMFLRNGFTATGAGERGAVRLLGAHIGGNLECSGARLGNGAGPALSGDSLQVGQNMFLTAKFTATGAGGLGTVRLIGAHVGINLNCDGARLRNGSGPAMRADGLQVDQNIFLRRGFVATGAGNDAAVRLVGAHIGGSLACDEGSISNGSGPALGGDRLQVGQAMHLRGLTGTGAGELGAVRLLGAHIGGNLECDRAQLGNQSGPALHGHSLQVDGSVFLRNGFTATGTGESRRGPPGRRPHPRQS